MLLSLVKIHVLISLVSTSQALNSIGQHLLELNSIGQHFSDGQHLLKLDYLGVSFHSSAYLGAISQQV